MTRHSTRPVVLASESPRRRALFQAFGIPFRVAVPRVQELHDERLTPAQLVRHNARLKADALAGSLADGVVVAADTVVALGARCFGKPKSADEARRMLTRLSGRTHQVYTGVCIIDAQRTRRWVDVISTNVTMRKLSPRDIARYVARMAHWDKAGAYAVQDLENLLIDRVDGSLSNVIGLPLHVVERRLRQCGVLG